MYVFTETKSNGTPLTYTHATIEDWINSVILSAGICGSDFGQYPDQVTYDDCVAHVLENVRELHVEEETENGRIVHGHYAR